MREWLGRHNGAIIFALSVLAIALLAANAWKHQVLSSAWLSSQKDALAALNSIVTLLIFLAASVFSYYRFFRGRTLSLRAELDLGISVHETPNEINLHAYTLTVKNVGTSTIWSPSPRITVIIHGPPDVQEKSVIDNWFEEQPVDGSSATASVIEADESVTFFGHRDVPKSAWAVTYMASVNADSGDEWFFSKTISNKEAGNKKTA